MRIPLDPSQRIPFSLADDEDAPTVFYIKPLTGSQKMHCMITTGVAKVDDAILFGLVGWDNFGEAEFNQTNMQENLDRLGLAEYGEIGGKILELSELNPVFKKKSPSPSVSSETEENSTVAENESASE